jgi:hypothetical protein
MKLPCINHQVTMRKQNLKYERVMNVVVSIVNFIRFHGFYHRQFQSFCRKLMLNMGTSFTIEKSDG